MAVPDFQSFFRPMLEALADGAPKTLAAMREHLRGAMAISDADFQEMLPSGVRTRFADRVYWANTHLYQAGLIARPASGVLAITDRGRNFLAKHQGTVLVSDLMQFPEFVAFRNRSSSQPPDAKAVTGCSEKTPQERMEDAYSELQATVAKELLDKIAASSAVGVDRIYAFAGSLEVKKATKGVILTTSSFTDGARRALDALGKRVVLIDGEELVRFDSFEE